MLTSESFLVPSKGPDTWREWSSDGKNLIIYWKVNTSFSLDYLNNCITLNYRICIWLWEPESPNCLSF